MSNSKKNYSLTLTDIITLIVLGLFPIWKIFNIEADFPAFVFILPLVIYIVEEILLHKKTFKQIITQGGKKFMGLLLILVIPGFIYLFISKAENNFMTLSFVGPKEHVIPDFSFVNQNNEIITNDDYRGNIYVANFFFTTCPTICPIMTYNMRIVQQRLSVYPNIKFLSHSIDPLNDTPERLLDYANEMRANLLNWNFVTGEKESIYNIAKEYFVNAVEDSLAPGGFFHSEYFVLVDKEGKIRSGVDKEGNIVGVYDGTKDTDIKDLIDDVKVLMAEYKRPKKDEK